MKFNLTHFKERAIFVGLTLAFRSSLDLFYIAYQPALEIKWKYLYNLRDGYEVFLTYALLAVVSFLLPVRIRKPSEFILFILFLFSYISASSFIMFNNQIDFAPFLNLTIFFVGMPILLNKKFLGRINLKFKYVNVHRTYVVFGIVVFVLLLTLIQIKTFGFRLKPPSLYDVYNIREVYKTQMGRISGYATVWSTNVLAVFLFVLGIYKKRVLFIVGAVLLDIYIYSITGFKTTIFSLVFVTVILVSYNIFKERISIFLMGFFLIFNSLILFFLDTPGKFVWNIGIYFTRRLFMVTGQLYFYFTDFVKTQPIDYFAQNFPFSLFIASHYSKPVPYIIGNAYFGIPDLAANANIFADFYFNLGPNGIVVLLFLLFIIMKIIDQLAKEDKSAFTFSLLTMPSLAMTNSALFTSLMTHGVLIVMIILYFYRPTNRFKAIVKDNDDKG